eukprot:SAG22_NODE_7543_length_730_cov_0.729002_2_plen_25_part_01
MQETARVKAKYKAAKARELEAIKAR